MGASIKWATGENGSKRKRGTLKREVNNDTDNGLRSGNGLYFAGSLNVIWSSGMSRRMSAVLNEL